MVSIFWAEGWPLPVRTTCCYIGFMIHYRMLMILPIVSISHCIVLISGYPPPPIPPPAYGSYPPQTLNLPPPLGRSGGGYGPGYEGGGYQQLMGKSS